MTTLDFKTAEEFRKAAGELGYRELQAYAKKLNIGPRNVKKDVLIENVNKYFISLKSGGNKKTSKSNLAGSPHRPKGSPKAGKPPARPLKPPTGRKSPVKESVGELLSRSSLVKKSSRSPAKAPARPLKSAPKKKSPAKQSPLSPLADILNLVFTNGDWKSLDDYLKRTNPSTHELEVAIGELNVTNFSWYLPHVLTAIDNFYPKLPIRTNNILVRALFAASLVTDDTMVFKLALRYAEIQLSASTIFWEDMIPETMEMDAERSFETAIRMGVFGMEMYRGEAGHGRAMLMIVRAMKTAQIDSEHLRHFLLLLEEMILNDEIIHYSLDKLNQITQNFL